MSVAHVVGSLSEIPATEWDALHDGRNPFLAHAFLSGLETHVYAFSIVHNSGCWLSREYSFTCATLDSATSRV